MERNSIRKEFIKNCFAKVQSTYDSQAIAQKQIANCLLKHINSLKRYQCALEIGCGINPILPSSTYNIKTYLLNDLNEYKLDHLNNYIFISGDAENIDWKIYPIDLFFSTSTIQWFDNPINFVKKISHTFPDADLFFSTFSEQNLYEINQIFSRGLKYPSLELWKKELGGEFHIWTDNIVLEFDSLFDILKHLKETGVNKLYEENSPCFTKDLMYRYETKYKQLFPTSSGQLSLSYTPIYICKKGMSK